MFDYLIKNKSVKRPFRVSKVSRIKGAVIINSKLHLELLNLHVQMCYYWLTSLWRVISVKIMFVLMFWIYTGIKMSVVTLMRWHAELKRDITEYVLTLRRFSWNYDMYII